MSRTTMTVAALLVALAVPSVAAAETTAFGQAKRGNLHVFSSIIKTWRAVDMMGGWLNESQSCTLNRRLRVKVEIFRSRGNRGDFFEDRITRRRMNCAEGGPNLGFNITAREAGFACSNGRWKPGRYDFLIRTKHLASGISSLAVLHLRMHRAC